MGSPSSPRYLIGSVVRAAAVLRAFYSPGEVLELRDIVARTGLHKAVAFRMLYTLHECGFIEKVGPNQYRCLLQLNRKRKYRIGFAADGSDSLFTQEISRGLTQTAGEEGIELLAEDNRYSSRVALRIAEKLIKEEVDLLIEYQADHEIAPAISAKCVAAGIPLIAVEIPHPGATYFGANNYEAGLIGGRYLGRWAEKYWHGAVDEILLLEQRRAGPLPQSRLTGTLAGIKEALPCTKSCRVVSVDGDSDFGVTLATVRRHLSQTSARHILVGALDDTIALGALRAFEEAGRLDCCGIMGQNAAPEARIEMRRRKSRLIGSVGYFPERYGAGLIHLALDMLAEKKVPPAMFVKHKLITPENVDHYYPNDSMMGFG